MAESTNLTSREPPSLSPRTTTPKSPSASPVQPNKRPSSPLPPSPKRRRLSPPSDPIPRPSRPSPTAAHPTDTTHDAPCCRPSNTHQNDTDKSRSRRLFGSLLTTLAQPDRRPRALPRQPASSSTDDEIAKRRRSDRERDDDREREREREERDARWKVWEGEVMRIRHQTLLAQARFLRTSAEPRVFYKPYLLSSDQQRTITTQISDAESLIVRERGAEVGSEVEANPASDTAAVVFQGGAAERPKEKRDEGEETGEQEKRDENQTAEQERGEGEKSGDERRDVDMKSEMKTDTHAYAHEVLLEGEEDNVIY